MRCLRVLLRAMLVGVRKAVLRDVRSCISTQLLVIIVSVMMVVIVVRQMQGPMDVVIKEEILQTKDMFATMTPQETEPEVIFKSGMGIYNTSRIPAIVHHKDTFLAFCEARKDTSHDIGNIHIVLRRGQRSGWKVKWGELQVVASRHGYRAMNPVPIVDKVLDVILLVYHLIPTWVSQWKLIRDGVFKQLVMVTRSFDNGETWTIAKDITASTLGQMKPPPALYAPGPGHGIQLKSGRLLVAGNYFVKDEVGPLLHYLDNFHNTTNYANVIASDDNGETWFLGGRIPFGVDPFWRPIHGNEATAVEIDKGHVCINGRTLHADLTRVVAISENGGETFGAGRLARELVEPGYILTDEKFVIPAKAAGCQASMIGFPAPRPYVTDSGTWVLFSNPASPKFRERLSIRLSKDGCKTWSPAWNIFSNFSGYSDLTYFEMRNPITGLKSQNFAVLFEAGNTTSHDSIMFKIFNIESLLGGLDKGKLKFDPAV
ncbi:LOW QUALITY PROTEIN: sialidase-4-like [Lytechinus variegatus]|uniref:LOW QUALITY PROTEIN: sialidase-4-like n=1 Tax=Lytechinus variegatus TaxID=7654 RepID=UPI001BB0DAA7|nr:LOW QUALITY PROTEIN: sialidase-4-like [Lytechinus variegatus]